MLQAAAASSVAIDHGEEAADGALEGEAVIERLGAALAAGRGETAPAPGDQRPGDTAPGQACQGPPVNQKPDRGHPVRRAIPAARWSCRAARQVEEIEIGGRPADAARRTGGAVAVGGNAHRHVIEVTEGARGRYRRRATGVAVRPDHGYTRFAGALSKPASRPSNSTRRLAEAQLPFDTGGGPGPFAGVVILKPTTKSAT